MAWALVNAAAAVFGDYTDSLSPGAPTGSGGILLLKVFSRNADVPSTPSGWTRLGNLGTTTWFLYGRTATGGADDTPTITFAGGIGHSAQLSRWSGGSLTVNIEPSRVTAGASGPPALLPVPAITPTVNGCLVLRAAMSMNDDGGYADTAAPAGDTILMDCNANNPTTNDHWGVVVYRIQTTAAAVSSGNITTTLGDVTSSSGYAIALAPAGGLNLKGLVHPSAQGVTSVSGVVFNAPSGGDITGTKIGEFTGEAFESALEGGQAVILVPVGSFGGEALSTSSTPVALFRTSTSTTGIVSCTVVAA